MIKEDHDRILFIYNGTEYQLTDYPYEPCIYIKKDDKIICTIHNAFTVYDLPKRFANGEKLLGIDGKYYNEKEFCKALCAAIESNRSEMDFPFAAKLSEKK